jgi:hypothetical protein
LKNLKNAQGIRSKNPFALPALCIFKSFYRFLKRMGQQSVQRQSSDFTCELRDEHKAEADVVVAVDRAVIVAVSRTAVLRIVVPATAA